MEDRQAAFVRGILQIEKESRQLVRGKQAFVDQRSARDAGDVEALGHQTGLFGAALDVLLGQIQRAFESVRVALAATWCDECLADARQRRASRAAELVGVDRYVAPAEKSQP